MDSSPLATGGIVVNKEFEHDMLPMIDVNEPPLKDRRLNDPTPAAIASTSTSNNVIEKSSVGEPKQLDGCILFKCCHCSDIYESASQMFVHWHSTHKRSRSALPFHFGIRCVIRCAIHKRNTVANNIISCTDCKALERTSKNKGDYLTQEMLTHLLSIDYVGAHLCEHCHSGFPNQADYKTHHRDEHSGLAERYKCTANQIEYKCPSCDLIGKDDKQMVRHVRSHHVKYQCVYCEKEYAQPKMVRVHHTKIHRVNDRKVRIVSAQHYRDIYERIEIIFPNGLVLTLLEASKTSYGNLDNVLSFADKLNTDEMAILAARNISPVRVVPTQVAAADNTESDSCPSVGQSPAKKKRFSAVSHNDIRIKNELPDKYKTSGVEFAKNRKTEVDLRQIFTDMNIGGSNIRVSCDRLANFMDISPVVRLDYLTPEYIRRKCK